MGHGESLQATDLVGGHVNEHRVVATTVALSLLCKVLRAALELWSHGVLENRKARLGRETASSARDRSTKLRR